MNSKEATSINIAITKQARENLATITESFGMTQKAVTERVIQWFASQPRNIQSVIFGFVQGNVAIMLLTEIVKSLDHPDSTQPPSSDMPEGIEDATLALARTAVREALRKDSAKKKPKKKTGGR